MNSGTEQVQRGVSRASEAGESLQQIVTSARSVADLVSKISAVTAEAREGVTQAATASSQLSAKAEQLQSLVGRFKIEPARR